MKLHIRILLITFLSCYLLGCTQSDSEQITIGIIKPLEHAAMDEIVLGFSETLKDMYDKPVSIKVENAQNDVNLLQAIIRKMRDARYQVIVPIGVQATQMTLAMIHDIPVVSLASKITDEERNKLQYCNVVAVHDEISPKALVEFAHDALPNLKQLTLIHSPADKIFPEVKEAVLAGHEIDITIEPMMVTSLMDLNNTVRALPSTIQGIFILKDHLIVSGISMLSKLAHEHQLPLITSDQGSVADGAMFALGVKEKDIGVEGAKLVHAILNEQDICQLPMIDMKNLTVFINAAFFTQSAQSIDAIIASAKKFNYQIEVLNSGKIKG